LKALEIEEIQYWVVIIKSGFRTKGDD